MYLLAWNQDVLQDYAPHIVVSEMEAASRPLGCFTGREKPKEMYQSLD